MNTVNPGLSVFAAEQPATEANITLPWPPGRRHEKEWPEASIQ